MPAHLPAGTTPEVIDTTSGRVRGRTHDGVTAFLGVPYAAAPTGARRFRPPEPRVPCRGILDATAHGPAAPQLPSRLQAAVGPLGTPTQGEDCLNLDIWTPSDDGGTAPHPVVVWLHGGAFLAGSGGQPWYDGGRLAREQRAVIVTINYRLGVLGFLHPPTDDHGSVANAGLLDQLAALRWVQVNIGAFGGDPRKVTVAGQSAGAQSILAMLHQHDAAGSLFHRAVLQSAPLGLPPLTPEQAARRTALLLDELGLDHGAGARDAPVGALLAAQRSVARREAQPLQLGPVFQLVSDGALVPSNLLGSTTTTVPVVLTTTAHEADAFTVPDPRIHAMTPPELRAALRPLLGEATEDRWRRQSRHDSAATPARTASDLVTAHYFHDDLEPLAHRLREHAEVRTIRFSWHPSTSALRAAHCIDLPFTFDNLDAWSDSPLLRGAGHAELEDRRRALHEFRRLLVHGDAAGGRAGAEAGR